MKISLLVTSLFCLFSSCSYIKNVDLLLGVEIQREAYVQSMPFIWRKDLIVVNVRLNHDTTSHEFIFDTGAFNSKVEHSLADELQLEVVTTKTNSTAQGISRKIEVIRIDSLQLGETWIYGIGAGKLLYDEKSASPCIASSGIIGANLMKLAHWKIDYQSQQLYFSDNPFEVNSESMSLPFERPLLSGTPVIALKINGKTISNVLLDVGYNGGIVLPISLADQFDSPDTQIILDQATSGIYGSNRDSLIVKKLSVDVAGHQTEIPVEFSSLNKALLGNEFLQHFILTIDYDRAMINLEKQQDISVAPPLTFMVGILDDTHWVVNRTRPDLPLHLGDTLLAVNGKKPHEVFASHCEYVLKISQFLEGDSILVQQVDKSYLNFQQHNFLP